MGMKRTLAFLLAILMMLSLCACGGADKSTADTAVQAAPMEVMAEEAPASAASYAVGTVTADSATGTEASRPGAEGDKIIYSCYAEIETQDFDQSLADIQQLIRRYGGFLESSSVRGNDYYASGSRSAEYVIRIPRESFEEVTGSLSTIGNVPYCSISAENISASYYDTESRLAAYRIEEERLLAMLELAETVEDMLSIEDRLTEVRYSIESLTTTILNWDSLINYSTLELSIREVVEYTEAPAPTYWQRIGRGFMSTLEDVGEFFLDLFRVIIVNLPVLVLLGAAVLIVVLVLRRRRRRKAAKGWGRSEEDKKDE